MRIPLRVSRSGHGGAGRDLFEVEVPETATVLDAIEAAWAHHDRSLMFRHACHHGSCGSCGIRVQGRERLPCVTPVREVWKGGGELLVEPLRGFPVVGDLVVDVGRLFQQLAASGMRMTRPTRPRPGQGEPDDEDGAVLVRFESCIECGLCVSACPTMASDRRFLGPAGLAAASRARDEGDAAEVERLLGLVDGEHGAWRCHGTWECSEVCPQGVRPAERIMRLRHDLLERRLRRGRGVR